jgi:hypothetical protein
MKKQVAGTAIVLVVAIGGLAWLMMGDRTPAPARPAPERKAPPEAPKREPAPDPSKAREEEAMRAPAAALEAALSKRDYDAARKAVASIPGEFAASAGADRMVARLERLKKELGIGEWREIFDGRSLAGWTAPDGGWSVEGGALSGRSSLPKGEKRAMADDLVYAETLSDFELEITWSAKGETAGAKTGALGILPRVTFEGGKRQVSDGYARHTQGKRLTVMVVAVGEEAILKIDGKETTRIKLRHATGQLCLSMAPGTSVSVEQVRLKRLR